MIQAIYLSHIICSYLSLLFIDVDDEYEDEEEQWEEGAEDILEKGEDMRSKSTLNTIVFKEFKELRWREIIWNN